MFLSDKFDQAVESSDINYNRKGGNIEINFQYDGVTYYGVVLSPKVYTHIEIDIPTGIQANYSDEKRLKRLLKAWNSRKKVVTWQINKKIDLLIHIHINYIGNKPIINCVKQAIVRAVKEFKKSEPHIKDWLSGKTDLLIVANKLDIKKQPMIKLLDLR